MNADLVRPYSTLTNADVPLVGGKNASLGELVRAFGAAGVRVPDGFATTVAVREAYCALSEQYGEDITDGREEPSPRPKLPSSPTGTRT